MPDLITQRCNTIIDVTDFLAQFCGHDPNSVGEMYERIATELKNRNLVIPEDCSFKNLTDPKMIDAVIYGVLTSIRVDEPFSQRQSKRRARSFGDDDNL